MLAFGTHARNQMWCVVLWFSLLCVAKAAKVITRQMQMGLVAEKKSKPNDQAEDYEDAAEGSSKPKPKSKAKAKAKAKGKPKAKATGKAKAKSTKRLASASAGPSETEQEERGPEEPEELDAPPPENDEDLGEASPVELPKLKRRGGKIGRSKSRLLLRRGRKLASASKASKTRAGKKKASKRGDGSAREIEHEEEEKAMEDATQHYEDDLGGDEHSRAGATRKRKAGKPAPRRVRNKAQAVEDAEPVSAPEEADDDENEEASEAEPEDAGDEGRKTFARRPRPSTRLINMARFDAIRDAYNEKIASS